jgi:L-ascorbate metabolism protein UlaG (beta-lactamase superfamily)
MKRYANSGGHSRRPWPALGVALAASSLAACGVAPQPKMGPYHQSDATISITRIVHGSYLIDFRGVRLLVDPWFYPRGLVNQREALGLIPRTLPTINGILITHGHQDHLDVKALAALSDHDVPVVVRRGLGDRVASAGYTDITELDWWDATRIADLIIQAVPADHRGGENGYIVESKTTVVYVGGDTKFFDGLHDIARRFPAIDIAMLPIGGLRFCGLLTEMRPADAARAVEVLGPLRIIPTHYGLMGPPPIYWTRRHPVEDFGKALAAAGLDTSRLVALEPGESWHYHPE